MRGAPPGHPGPPGREAARTPPYRGRFAPTPSGPLHFGSIVAALGSCLDARAHGGEWHLRIDDLDSPRVAPGAEGEILRCLEALGFEWDGALVHQSTRREAYHAALHRLRSHAAVYPCACSRSEIAAIARLGKDGPVYPGTCRDGMPIGAPARALRVLTAGSTLRFEDRVLGTQQRDLERGSGDFPLYRADGVFSFHLAAAVDDAEGGMTDIVRGADLLESSARQAWLLLRMGLPVPRYAHLPVALDAAGRKLSKQTHAAAVDTAQPVTALVRALRFLGQMPPPELERDDVRSVWRWAIPHWDLARVPRSAHAVA
jgi:glutamyl-Q tRNA(Asp) synthetase